MSVQGLSSEPFEMTGHTVPDSTLTLLMASWASAVRIEVNPDPHNPSGG